MDSMSGKDYMWDGLNWAEITNSNLTHPLTNPLDVFVPTAEQLEKYPALKKAWEDYLIIRKLIGK